MQTITHDTHWILLRAFKFGSSIGLAILVTGALIFLMCTLIAMDPPEITENNIEIPIITMPEVRDITPQRKVKVEKPIQPKVEPKMPKSNVDVDPSSTRYTIVAPTVNPGSIDVDNGAYSATAIPVLKIAPRYPERARHRGVEGFVDLMFDIGPTGKTENIRILSAEPQGLFERASVLALKKWKYKPAYDGEIAVVQKNQTTRISFTLDE